MCGTVVAGWPLRMFCIEQTQADGAGETAASACQSIHPVGLVGSAQEGTAIMQLRVGFEMTYQCAQPTPMMLALSIHPSRATDLLSPDRLVTDPAVPATSYRRSLRQPVQPPRRAGGPVRLEQRRAGQRQRRARRRGTVGHADRSGGPALIDADLLAGQPLLRDRNAVRHRVAAVRLGTGRLGARAGHLRLRAPTHRIRLSTRAAHAHRVGGPYRRPWRVPRLRPSGDRLVPLHEHSGALLHRIPG